MIAATEVPWGDDARAERFPATAAFPAFRPPTAGAPTIIAPPSEQAAAPLLAGVNGLYEGENRFLSQGEQLPAVFSPQASRSRSFSDQASQKQVASAFADCPFCNTQNEFPQTPGTVVVLRCGNCKNQFQTTGKPTLTKPPVGSVSTVPFPPAASVPLPSTTPAPVSPVTSVTLPSTASLPLPSAASLPVASQRTVFDGVSRDAIARCERRTAAIAARTRELLARYSSPLPSRGNVSQSVLASPTSPLQSRESLAGLPMPMPLQRGDGSISPLDATRAVPESPQRQFLKSLSMQALPPQPVPASPTQGLGALLRQRAMSPMPSVRVEAPLSPQASMRPRSLSPRPMVVPGMLPAPLSYVPIPVAPMSPSPGARSPGFPASWPPVAVQPEVAQMSAWVTVPSSSPLLQRSLSHQRTGGATRSPTVTEPSSPVGYAKRPTSDYPMNIQPGPQSPWLPVRTNAQESLAPPPYINGDSGYINGDSRPREASLEAPVDDIPVRIQQELGDTVNLAPARLPLDGALADDSSAGANKAYEDLAAAVVCSSTAADLAAAALAGRRRTVPSSTNVPALDLAQERNGAAKSTELERRANGSTSTEPPEVRTDSRLKAPKMGKRGSTGQLRNLS